MKNKLKVTEKSFGKFLFLFPLIFIILTFDLFSIEVEGYITEDTTWDPENNPYHVIDNIFVNQGVTLTILPGTEIKINSARLASEPDLSVTHYNNGTNLTKMFWIHGKLYAEGTEDEPIIFTRAQDSLYFHWGIIYFDEDAQMPYFSNCRFEYSSRIFISLGNIPTGAICLYNYKAIIENSIFLDNFSGVEIRNQAQGIIIKDNNFIYIDEIHPSLYGFSITKIRSTGLFENYTPVLVAGNYFEESNAASIALQCIVRPLYAVNNTICGNVGIRYLWYLWSGVSSFFFENEFLNCITGIDAHSVIQSDSLYIKKNNFIGGNDGIDIN